MRKKHSFLILMSILILIPIWGFHHVPSYQAKMDKVAQNRTVPIHNLESYYEYCKKVLIANGSQFWNSSVPTNGVPTACVLEDINSDGIQEVVIGSEDSNVYCLDGSTGQVIWINDNSTGDVQVVKAIEDIDGDNYQDIAFGGFDARTRLLNGRNGSLLWENTDSFSAIFSMSIIDDLDNDGFSDVVVGSTDIMICVSGKSGVQVWNNTDIPTSIQHLFAIPDVTFDGRPDLVAGFWGFNGLVCVDGWNGSFLWAFNVGSGTQALSIIEDMNGDGLSDVIAGDIIGNPKLFCVDGKNGVELWNITYTQNIYDIQTIEDVDFDGFEDVIIGLHDHVQCVNGRNGTFIWNQTNIASWPDALAIIKDENDDGYEDVLMGVSDHIYCFNGRTGEKLWDSPGISSGATVYSISTIDDINGDARDDVVITTASTGVNVYCLSGRAKDYIQNHRKGTIIWNQSSTANPLTYLNKIEDVTGDGIEEVLVSDYETLIFCLDGRNGTIIWFCDYIGGGYVGNVITVIDDMDEDGYSDVVLGTDNNYDHLISGKNGNQLKNISSGVVDSTQDIKEIEDIDGDGFNDIITARNAGNVSCLNGKNFGIIWVNTTNPSATVQLAIIEDINNDGYSNIIVGRADGSVECHSGINGSEIWAFGSSGMVIEIEIIEDINKNGYSDIVFSSEDDGILCLDGKDGTFIWLCESIFTASDIDIIRDVTGDGLDDVIAADNDTPYWIYCLDGKNGNIAWYNENISDQSYCINTIEDLNNDHFEDIIVGTNRINALDGRNGTFLWQNNGTSDSIRGQIVLEDLSSDGISELIVILGNITMCISPDGDDIPPMLNSSAPLEVEQYIESETITWNITELSIGYYRVLINESVSNGGCDWTPYSHCQTIFCPINESIPLGFYNYTIICIDLAGNVASDMISIKIKDSISPLIGVLSTPGVVEQDTGMAYINWTVNENNPHLYRVMINGSTENGGSNWALYTDGIIQYSINQSVPVGYYNYSLEMNDTSGNYASDFRIVYINDSVNPGPVIDLQASFSNSVVTLSWTPPVDSDVISYRIYRSENLTFLPGPASYLGNTSATTYNDGSVQTGKTYYYIVLAVDDANNYGNITKAFVDTSLGDGEGPGYWYWIIIVMASVAAIVGIFLIKRRGKETIIPMPKKLPGKVEVLREYDYVGAGIRFKIAVRNNSPKKISDISCILNVKDQFGIDSRIKEINVLDPGESRGIDYMLYPLTCGKSYVEGVVSFKTAFKETQSITISPKLVEVKCPLVKPMPLIEKEISEWQKKLQKSFTEIGFQSLNKKLAFEIACEQVSALDLNEIKRDSENFSAYYAGEAKVSGNKLIIKASIAGDVIICEVWTSDQKQAIGFLAYIKNLIVMSLNTHKKLKGEIAKFAQNALNAFEITARFFELIEIIKEEPQVEKTLLTLDEITTRITRYFPTQERLQDIHGVKARIEQNFDLSAQLTQTENYYLQSYILFWLEELINVARTNMNLFLQSSIDRDEKLVAHLNGELTKVMNQYNEFEKLHSLSILRYFLVIHEPSGVTIFQHQFGEWDLDPDLISGFLTAIQSFGTEVSKEEAAMKSLAYQNFNIDIYNRKFIKIALVLAGNSTHYIDSRVQTFIQEFEERFSITLEHWTGDVLPFQVMTNFLKTLFI